MNKFSAPPKWNKYISGNFFEKALKSQDLLEFIKKADKDYIYWSKFKYLTPPPSFSIEEAWAFLRFSRLTNQEHSSITGINKVPFRFNITKIMNRKLSFIDSNMSGFLVGEWRRPTISQKNQLLISSLSEEAIASSQIEGANTSRKIAKEMILSERKPKTRDEQMIINNYQVMQRLMDWKDTRLSKDMLLDIQKNITVRTLENENDSGRLRMDEDGINVVDRLSGEIVFTPPKEKEMQEGLEQLIIYANQEESEDNFTHPVIKASLLHFWLAYLHPFVDGNGRTARALFYWYLLRKNYWMFQYLSVSRIIRKKKRKYENAFLYSELDQNDLTYFLIYIIEVIVEAYEDFMSHYEKKLEKDAAIEKIAHKLRELNERQVSLLQYLNEHKDKTVDIATHRNKWKIAYETARTDIQKLEKKGYLTPIADSKKYEYIPNTVAIRDLFKG